MTVPLAKVKALCTESETNLVQASRRPQVSRLTVAQAKRHRDRAKKLADKWRDLAIKQARTQSSQKGYAEKVKRTEMKQQIFEETLAKFDEQLAKLEAAGAEQAPATKGKPKSVRASEHRSQRAATRKELSKKTGS